MVGLLAAHTLHVLQTSHAQRVVRTGLHAKPVELEGMGGITSVWLWAALQVGDTMRLQISCPAPCSLVSLWTHKRMHRDTVTCAHQML